MQTSQLLTLALVGALADIPAVVCDTGSDNSQLHTTATREHFNPATHKLRLTTVSPLNWRTVTRNEHAVGARGVPEAHDSLFPNMDSEAAPNVNPTLIVLPSQGLPTVKSIPDHHDGKLGTLAAINPMASDAPPTSLTENCKNLHVDLDLDKQQHSGKKAFVQAACPIRVAASENLRWRCSKMKIEGCFSNQDGTLVGVTDNKGKWAESCSDCAYLADFKTIQCTCWQKNKLPNVTEISLDEILQNVDGLLHCGRDNAAEDLKDLGKCGLSE
ncbi:hypothetical protein B0H66DRAFT_148598 [Apodospora peruviana]|uniref:Cyanovirin-N domain-containing protein n=1 Tax=Apodospora peruviana TaxID=516989 RepID=A0AAE0MCN3_9PEZI|nr:hypothetical protein B0H66DRAFT_148598 [Apodospora peruviana]